ncbi:TetR/AcrR family transcriptional regulator [Tenacibaculum sp. HL-MS23]|uniref:TetR/AcrR family transcriptional regulator n=1 Tax=Tenacibaculum TaxID=104267 RepID=UPI001C4F79A7|nr:MULTISPECIES: TetR/AcrR family transcriptional regulator [Tenacibaculum]QXP72842.1 TetR/AcrR family transcriptional regulator [Tenacibaculum sp. AHE14PA]QXP76756.1 TetR/AcrR family transcriptional regulator [Tenacibaculum sp. AHE15PA]WNW00887.1 TetR/AcrR family transcriptional regulator [Tenacibaculum sp. HL-MS23]
MRDKIINKAGEMFLSLGFKSITMDDIAKELGISKKTLYKYFSNKAALVDASTEAVHNTINDTINKIKEHGYNAIEEEFAVKAIFKEMFKNAKTSPMFQLKKYYPETYTSLIEREVCMFRDCNVDNLKKGIAQGFYRGGLNIDLIVNFYFTLIFGVFDSEMYGGEMQELIKIEYQILEYHIRAIATDKGLEELEKQLKIINQN